MIKVNRKAEFCNVVQCRSGGGSAVKVCDSFLETGGGDLWRQATPKVSVNPRRRIDTTRRRPFPGGGIKKK